MTGADRPTNQPDAWPPASEELGRMLRAHFEAVADERPTRQTLDAISARTARTGRRPAWLVELVGGGPAAAAPLSGPALLGRRPLLVLALLGLLAIAIVGAAALAGSLLNDPLRGRVAPAPTVEPTAPAAVVSPTATPLLVGEGETAPPPCPATASEPPPDGPLPAIGAPATPSGTGVIAVEYDGRIITLDPTAAEPPTPGLWPTLIQFPAEANVLVRHPAWSPDGRWLAFVAWRIGGCEDLYVVPSSGGVATRATDHQPDAGIGRPVWSPDGRWLAYTADPTYFAQLSDPPRPYDPEAASIQLVRLGDDGSVQERRQVWTGDVGTDLDWSATGALAFTAGDVARPSVLRPGALEAASIETPVTGVGRFAWSPDGQRLLVLYESDGAAIIQACQTGQLISSECDASVAGSQGDGQGLAIIDVDDALGKRTRQIWGLFDPADADWVTEIAWTQGGGRVAFALRDHGSDPDGSAGAVILDVAADGTSSEPRQLVAWPPGAENQVHLSGLAASPDGTSLVYGLTGVGGFDDGVWVVGADGSGHRQIGTSLLGWLVEPAWQPIP